MNMFVSMTRKTVAGICAALLLAGITQVSAQTEGRYESPHPTSLSKVSTSAAAAATAIMTDRAGCLSSSSTLTGISAQAMVYTAGLQSFPTAGADYLVLSTGFASQTAGTAPVYRSHNMSGPALPANAPYSSPDNVPSFDVITLSVDFALPAVSSASLSFDWQFLSEENPTFTNSFTDYFRADVFDGNGNWLGNIARLPNNAQVSTSTAAAYSNAPGGSSASPSPPFPSPNDVIYNAATSQFTSSIDLSMYGGQTVTVQFRLADARDRILNSAVFLDNLDLQVCPMVADFTLSPDMLWPPNHKMHTISVNAPTLPSCFGWKLMSVTSNEPDNGEDDGNTINDIQNVDPGTADMEFDLRAERSGIGTGRVYTATFVITDASGNIPLCTKTAQVVVPLNMTPKARYSNKASIPGVALLEQNYPNPFNPSTTINYTLEKDAEVTLRVYDMFGREVASLVSENQNEGSYSVPFDASGLSSGMYVYTLTVDGAALNRTMNLMK